MNKLFSTNISKALLNFQSMNNKMLVRNHSDTKIMQYETITVTNPHEYVYHVQFNRPNKRNAMNPTFFRELNDCFQKLSYDTSCRSIVLSGNGKGFTAGLDMSELSSIINPDTDDVGRRGFHIKKIIDDWQASISSPESCYKPVIASVHGFCVGGGIDLITSCDIRYCSADAWFSVKEVDIGLAADLGTLQRFPKIVGNDSLVRELIFTARKFNAEEAKQLGLISKILPDQESCVNESLAIAKIIASKSPIAVQGSKINLIYSRDHGVPTSLKYMVAWNSGMIQSEDTIKASMASLSKEEPVFSKL